MRRSAGHHVLRLLGVLCAVVGVLAWIGLAGKAISDLDGVTPQSDAGERLMVLALTGTVLMIVGAVLLHVAEDASEREGREGRTPPR